MSIYDDNIPMPDNRRTTRLGRDLSDMKIGQSLFVAGLKCGSSHQVYGETQKKHGFKFATKKTVENGIEGRRIWRIA